MIIQFGHNPSYGSCTLKAVMDVTTQSDEFLRLVCGVAPWKQHTLAGGQQDASVLLSCVHPEAFGGQQ